MKWLKNPTRLHSYDACLDALNGIPEKRLSSILTLRYEDGSCIFRLYDTDIIVYHDDNTVTLSTGGYATVTTKEKMSEYSPFQIGQSNDVFYVNGYRFFDGICFNLATRQPLNDDSIDIASIDAWNKTVKKLVKRYIDGLDVDILRTCLEDMSGDCWYCAQTEDGRILGDTHPKNESHHLYSHIEDDYYLGSVFIHAVEHIHRNPQLVLSYAVHSGRLYDVKNAVRRYIQDVLLIRA